MAGVTDRAYREVARRFFDGTLCSEMVSINALYYKNEKTFEILQTEPEDVCQIFGRDHERLAEVAERLNEQPCSAIDINCGCPAPKITGNGEGSWLMREPEVAECFIKTAVQTLEKPVTVKFRLGWDYHSVNCVEFAKMCEAAGATRICLHARTRSQMYEGEAKWEYIKQVVEAVDIPVIGNGDIRSAEDAVRMMAETGCAGVAIARAAMGNPWILTEIENALYGTVKNDLPSRYETAVLHFQKLLQYKGKRAVLEMRKHASWYMKNIEGAAKLRQKINTATTEPEMMAALEYLK